MAQVKIYGNAAHLERTRPRLSNAIHQSLMSAIGLPADKRIQRFIPLTPENFIYPPDRAESYTIVEISMFAGRSAEAKRTLIQTLYANIETQVGITPHNLEITLFETPCANWGIRGLPGDELELNYTVDV